jgi:hypothetical protein
VLRFRLGVSMTTASADPVSSDAPVADACYRCGYELRGIADDQPCPECGLLAGRSRRPTDELHNTRPGWLRRLSWGVWLILLSMAAGVAWPFVTAILRELVIRIVWRNGRPVYVPRSTNLSWSIYGSWYHLPWLGADLAALILLVGILLLSSREGYPPTDQADAWRRRLLRLLAIVPLAALALMHVASQSALKASTGKGYFLLHPNLGVLESIAFLLVTVGCAPLPILLYIQLRSLAKRARSAHLAEHCVIVGVGNSLTLLYIAIYAPLQEYAERLGFGDFWSSRSSVALALELFLAVLACLFALWNAYLLLSFAVAFGCAARRLRSQWRKSDRATAH